MRETVMPWSEVTKTPTRRILQQFAGLCLVVLTALASWRTWNGDAGAVTWALGLFGVLVGGIGLAWPPAVRWVFTTWMIAAFPIGWVVSRVALTVVYYLLFTPVAVVFRLMRRDVLQLRRRRAVSYWSDTTPAADVSDYLRQS
jgi:hypothetical protein